MITGRSQARIRNRENRNRENRNRENQDPYSSPEDDEQYMSMFRRLDRLRRRLDTTMPTPMPTPMDTPMDTPTPIILDFP